MVNNELKLPKDVELAKQVLANNSIIEQQLVNRGYLGKLWGSAQSVPNNIAALTIIILISTGVIYTLLTLLLPADKISLSIKDFWSIITPLITLAIGYLFGDKTKNKEL
jgi:hypothetical protein